MSLKNRSGSTRDPMQQWCDRADKKASIPDQPVVALTPEQRQNAALRALMACRPAIRSWIFSLFNHAGQVVGHRDVKLALHAPAAEQSLPLIRTLARTIISLRGALEMCADPKEGWPHTAVADAYEASRRVVPELEGELDDDTIDRALRLPAHPGEDARS